MHRRQLLKAGTLAAAGGAIPGAVLAAVAEPIRFEPTIGGNLRHWTPLAPIPGLGLQPGVHSLQEWVATHALVRWRIGTPDGTNSTAIIGDTWPIVLAAYTAGHIRPNMEIQDNLNHPGEGVVLWTPDHQALIAAHGSERALEIAWTEYTRREEEKLADMLAQFNAERAEWRERWVR
jgi:hypothetical protein